MDDMISRQALMKEFSDFVRASNNSDFARTPTWNDAVSLVVSMPSAQPERKKGKWIKEHWHGEHTRRCSACNITQTVTTCSGKVNFNYCPYCGADMRGEQNE